jgi:myo-inositol 2-dehydrogenase / D-chiro-inositol 1-dehydrogenase
MPPNQRQPVIDFSDGSSDDGRPSKIRCAVLGCGMMGQEHISYLLGFPDEVSIDFSCDPHEPSLQQCTKVIQEFRKANAAPTMLLSELELYKYADQIDLLVIATPNYQHTDTLLRWGQQNLTILLEKPVAVSSEQLDRLRSSQSFVARIWVAMEYRFIPAIAKLIELLPTVGDIKMVTIRENRFPFLKKIGEWNRDRNKTGDSLVEKW